MQSTISSKLPSSLSCKAVKINNTDRTVEFVKTEKGNIKKIHSLPNESFNVGDYLTYKDTTCLIIEIDSDNEVYMSGKIQETNYTLTFQHPTTGDILSYPCIDEKSSLATGEDRSNIITTPNAVHRLTLPLDEMTVLLKSTDDKPCRFFLDKSKINPATVKVTDTDTTSKDGLVILTVEKDLYRPNEDNIDLWVCNYFKPNTQPAPIGETYATIDVDDLILGMSNQIYPTFYDENGIVNDVVAKWSVIKPVGHDKDVSVDYDGNILKIVLKDNFSLIGKTVKIEVSDENGNYSSIFDLKIGMG